MADNTILNSGSGGDTIRTDDNAGVKTPVSKIELGADGVFSEGLVGSANPMPVVATTGSDVIGAVTQSGTWNVTNVSGTISLPTGAATSALQTTGNSSLSTIAGDTTSLDGKVTACNTGAVVIASGTVTAVTAITNALPAGTNAIGKLAANSGVDIGDVDVTSIVPGTGATNLGKAIDSASGSTDTGIATLAIRDDSLSSLTPVEGDYVPLRVNSTGSLYVTGGGGGTQYNVDDAAGATDTGTLLLAVRDDSLTTLTPVDGDYVQLRTNSTGALHVTGGGGGTEYTEDVATANPIVGTATLMERDDALTTVTPIEGDWIGLRGSAEGALWVQDFNSDGILADTTTIAGDTTSIDGKITACNTGAVVISSGTVTAVTAITNALPAGTNAIGKLAANSGVDIGDVDVTSVPAPLNVVGGGTEAAAQRVTIANDSTGLVSVDDGGGALTVDWAGTAPPIGAGVEATALRVTVATDSTGVLSIDDNGASLTVDTPAVAAGGATPGKLISATGTNATPVKASAGTLYMLCVFNTNAAARYCKFYNKASAPTVGTDTPVLVFTIPGNTAGSGFVVPIPAQGIAFSTGIAFALTTGAADADTGPVASAEIVVSYAYK